MATARTVAEGGGPDGVAQAGSGHYRLSHLRALEAQSIHVFREVAAEFERPTLLFSGGKDSIVMLHLAREGLLAGLCALPRPARGHRAQL